MTPALRLALACVPLVLGALAIGQSQPASAQKAAYLVQSKVDVDGDGRIDEVRIDDMGTISVDIAGKKKAGAWTPLAASGKVVSGSLLVDRKLDPKGRALIVATSKLRTSSRRVYEETVILAWTPGKFETLWRGPVGATGSDGSKYVSIELGKFGLIKYASREGVSRCDGETAHLDPQRYDFNSGSFRGVRQAVRVASSPQTPVLLAKDKADDPSLESALGFWFRAASASSSTQARSAADLIAPVALSDRDDNTAWVEGKGGFGRGEFVTLKSSVGKVRVKALRLVLGHGAARGDYNRPRRLALLLGKSHKFWIQIDKDPKGPQWIHLPSPIASECISLIVDDVFPQSASKNNKGRTAISEISVVSEEDLSPELAGALLASRIAEGKGGADLGRLVTAFGAAAAPALIKASQSSKTPRARMRLRLAMARIPAGSDPLVARSVAEEVAAGVLEEGGRKAQYDRLASGLVTMEAHAIDPLRSALALGKLSPAASERAIGVLSQIATPSATEALVEVLGKGSRKQRYQLVRATAQRPEAAPTLLAALQQAPPGERRADLLSATSFALASSQSGTPERIAFSSILENALRASADTPGKEEFETHYQAVQAAARLGGAAQIEALLAGLQSSRQADTSHGIALREQLVSALARSAARQPSNTPEVTAVLRAALVDKNPGVRLAVLGQLGKNSALLDVQAQQLSTDAWPEVRRALAASLAGRCDAGVATAALSLATRSDSDESVARTSLTALVQCRAPTLFPLLLELMDDTKRPLDLRLYAARQAGSAAPAGAASTVLERFQKARTRALTNRKEGKLAAALTVSLATIASDQVVATLEDSAQDPAVPNLQAAAITALATLCRPSSKPVLRKLKQSSNPSVATAARSASGRCN